MKNILCSFLIIIIFGLNLLAGNYTVKNASELNALSNNLTPGDTVFLQNGIWDNQEVQFKANGALGDSVVIMAETPGQVIFTGKSKLRFGGTYIKIDGLRFIGGYTEASHVIEFRNSVESSYCRVTNCSIVNFNPENLSKDYKYLSIYGKYNRVDHCYFEGKKNSGTTLVVWLPSNGQPVYHQIDHNYFGPRPELGYNGGETIRIGTSDYSMNSAQCVVEYNYFEECDGEIEVISNKSCDNIYRYNTFYRCNAVLTLRHGNRCTVEGNYFIGDNKPGTGGVRIIGEDHKVINNYFENLAGDDWYSALVMMNGVPNSPLNRYFQVKNAVVAFNTFVNCKNVFMFGAGSDAELSLPPLDCVVANNVVSTEDRIVTIEDEPINLLWEGNIFKGSLGIETPQGITLQDPLLIQTNDLFRPSETSPVIDAAVGSYDFVNDDIDGQSRGELKDVGVDEVSGEAVLRRRLTSDDAGPNWTKENYTAGVFITINGRGSVSSNPEGFLFEPGSVVSLTATPESGSTFESWSGDISSTDNPVTVTIDSHKYLTANFNDPNYYSISFWVTGNGSVTKTPDKAEYTEGETVELRAVPDAGWIFSAWSGSLSGTENPLTIVMDQNKVAAATFVLNTGNEMELDYSFQLEQNYPNPFNPATSIIFSLPFSSTVSLEIFNAAGEKIENLIKNRNFGRGIFSVKWESSSLTSSVYFYRITAADENGKVFTETKKMVYLK